MSKLVFFETETGNVGFRVYPDDEPVPADRLHMDMDDFTLENTPAQWARTQKWDKAKGRPRDKTEAELVEEAQGQADPVELLAGIVGKLAKGEKLGSKELQDIETLGKGRKT